MNCSICQKPVAQCLGHFQRTLESSRREFEKPLSKERPDAAPPKDRDALVDEGVNILWKWMHEAEPGGPNRDQATAVGVITGEIARLRELLAPPPTDAAQPTDCFDCGRHYGNEYGFPDLVLPDDVWVAISPKGNDGGMLCPSCICKRLADYGFEDIPAVFRSGPCCVLGTAPAACSQCGGETYVVDLTCCRGCSNEFYTAEQSRAVSRKRLFTHPEDAPRPDNASLGSTVSGGERPEQVEDAPESGDSPGGPKIVCLCGSTRFWREFQRAGLRETMAGRIVLSIGAASGTDDEHFGNLDQCEYDRIKTQLDELHLRKIDLADEILVLNVGGYVGESTARELQYARDHGKPVRFLEVVDRFKGGETKDV